MKKKALLLLCGLLITFSAYGCGSSSSEKETEAATEKAAADDVITGYLIDNADQYVTLGTYVGMDIEKPIYEVSADEISMEIENRLYDSSEVSEVNREAQMGDLVTADITATVQGESEPSVSEEGYSIELGYEEFGADFDAALVGCKAGDSVKFSCSYDENTWFEDWIGKTVDFKITVSKIEEVIIPEYTDDFVKNTLGYDSKEAYEASVKETLEADYAEQSDTEAKYNALISAIEASTFDGYPDKLYDSCSQDVSENYAYMAEMYGMSEDELLEAYDMTQEDLEAEVLDTVNQRLFISALCQKEDLSVTSEEYSEYLEGLYPEYGYDDAESFETDYGKEALLWELYAEKVSAFILEQSNVYEAPVSLEEDFEDIEEEDDEELDGLAEETE